MRLISKGDIDNVYTSMADMKRDAMPMVAGTFSEFGMPLPHVLGGAIGYVEGGNFFKKLWSGIKRLGRKLFNFGKDKAQTAIKQNRTKLIDLANRGLDRGIQYVKDKTQPHLNKGLDKLGNIPYVGDYVKDKAANVLDQAEDRVKTSLSDKASSILDRLTKGNGMRGGLSFAPGTSQAEMDRVSREWGWPTFGSGIAEY